MTTIQTLKKRAETAKAWRSEHAEMANHGYVLLYRGKVFGWASKLDRPQDYRPGVIAIGVGGIDEAIYQACDGNDQAGAQAWAAFWNPAPRAA